MVEAVTSILRAYPLPLWIFAAVVVFAAEVLRGFTGFGFGLSAVPALTLFLEPQDIVPAVVIIAAAVGLQLLRRVWSQADWPSVKLLTIGAIIGTPFGAWVLASVSADLMRAIIGSICIAFARGLAGEEVAVHAQPVIAAAVAFAFVPGEGVVHLDQRFYRDVRGAPDAAGFAPAIDDNHMFADRRHRLATRAEISGQAGSGALRAVDDEIGQFVGHFRAIAEGHHVVAVMADAGGGLEGGPEGLHLWRLLAHVTTPAGGGCGRRLSAPRRSARPRRKCGWFSC